MVYHYTGVYNNHILCLQWGPSLQKGLSAPSTSRKHTYEGIVHKAMQVRPLQGDENLKEHVRPWNVFTKF